MADHFLERREVGILNVGGTGVIAVDSASFVLAKRDGLYVGRGARDVTFASAAAADPAQFYLLSAPAHTTYPTVRLTMGDANTFHLGDALHSNVRTIYQYIHRKPEAREAPVSGSLSCPIVRLRSRPRVPAPSRVNLTYHPAI